jgi:hypothetical protein
MDPYVNNPGRYPEFGIEMRNASKDKATYDHLFDVVTFADQGRQQAQSLLIAICEETRSILDGRRVVFTPPRHASLDLIGAALGEFLEQPSNGLRLQAVCYGSVTK